MPHSGDSFRDLGLAVGSSNPMDTDYHRGRTRDRSMTRSKALRTEETSTLRGRSRRRSISPFSRASRASSPHVKSPANRLLHHNRLRDRRREHCPSRVVSPAGQEVLQRTQQTQRTRSRSRGPRVERQELHRSLESFSSLRNEVFISDEESTSKTSR